MLAVRFVVLAITRLCACERGDDVVAVDFQNVWFDDRWSLAPRLYTLTHIC